MPIAPSFLYSFFFWIILSLPLLADHSVCCGRVELAPAYVHIDMLEFGKTGARLDMGGLRGDANLLLWECLSVKPGFLLASGGSDHNIAAASLALGQCLPLGKLVFVPEIGITYNYLATTISFGPYSKLWERFRSISYLIGLSTTYTFCVGTRAYALFQYAWSYTTTQIEKIGQDKSWASGPIIAGMIEQDIAKEWSLNLGAGYNLSLNEQRFGLRGYGVKLGVVYWF